MTRDEIEDLSNSELLELLSNCNKEQNRRNFLTTATELRMEIAKSVSNMWIKVKNSNTDFDNVYFYVHIIDIDSVYSITSKHIVIEAKYDVYYSFSDTDTEQCAYCNATSNDKIFKFNLDDYVEKVDANTIETMLKNSFDKMIDTYNKTITIL